MNKFLSLTCGIICIVISASCTSDEYSPNIRQKEHTPEEIARIEELRSKYATVVVVDQDKTPWYRLNQFIEDAPLDQWAVRHYIDSKCGKIHYDFKVPSGVYTVTRQGIPSDPSLSLEQIIGNEIDVPPCVWVHNPIAFDIEGFHIDNTSADEIDITIPANDTGKDRHIAVKVGWIVYNFPIIQYGKHEDDVLGGPPVPGPSRYSNYCSIIIHQYAEGSDTDKKCEHCEKHSTHRR